ncbi:hypothetical protein [Burkholderia sp. AW49-1]
MTPLHAAFGGAVMLPIFVSFVVLHFGPIVYGVAGGSIPTMIVPDALHGAYGMSQALGVAVMPALPMRAFSLGGVYASLEAGSNNVSTLADSHVQNRAATT